MGDPINPAAGIANLRPAERIAAVKATPHTRRKDEDSSDDFSFEDKIDIAVPAPEVQVLEEIDLSIAMIRAVIAKELPPETLQALLDFAPLGDLSNGAELCDRAEQRGVDFVPWPNTMSLAQALALAAN